MPCSNARVRPRNAAAVSVVPEPKAVAYCKRSPGRRRDGIPRCRPLQPGREAVALWAGGEEVAQGRRSGVSVVRGVRG